ncbi:MAG: alpha/beta hydrolase [Actinobacteria bacterium]|nr:alpha/beta hydrolase [Actinomycetota bacterium]
MLIPDSYIKTSTGPTIALYDLGGSGPPLILAHATGLCGAVLSPIASHLRDHFSCMLIDERAHGNSTSPPDSNFDWHLFARDILDVIDHLGLSLPYGFGHSCGGASLLLAEEARPHTFAALYCYEPVIFPSDDPMPPTKEGNHLAQGALRRRTKFPSYKDSYDNFTSKEPFNKFTDECLHLYIDNGFQQMPDGSVELKCKRHDESAIYSLGMSHDAYRYLSRVSCPVTLACGSEDLFLGVDVQSIFLERLADAKLEVFDGLGHFGPVQDPERVAKSILHAFSVSDKDTGGASYPIRE